MNESGMPGGAPFPTTRWSEVNRAGSPADSVSSDALATIFSRYRRPLLIHLQAKFGVSGEKAEDWLQHFTHDKILEQGVLGKARRERGRFRTFLLNCLDNFVLSQLRRENAQKRSPGGEPVPIHEFEAEPREFCRSHPDPFLVAWVQEILVETLTRMRQECLDRGYHSRWQVFDTMLLEPTLNGTPKPAYAEIVEAIRFKSTSEAQNTFETAKRQFKRTFRHVVTEFSDPECDVDEEIKAMRQILGELC